MRIDRFLWFVRLVKTRSVAQSLAVEGHIRLSGRRVDRAHAPVRVGDTLSLAVHGQVRVLTVLALPARRGPAPEARSHYQEHGPEARPPYRDDGSESAAPPLTEGTPEP